MREGQPAEQSAQFSIGNSPCMRGGQPRTPSPFEGDIGFSPHARGSTHETDTVNSDGMIHPACAGVNPVPHLHWRAIQDSPPHAREVTLDITEAFDDRENSPHVRGSTQPMQILGDGFVLKFTPHARGSTLPQIAYYVATRIHPACAGINPDDSGSIQNQKDSPRTRGGQPHVQVQWLYDDAFTPHARGSTL